MKTQLILFHRPANNAIIPDGTGTPTEAYTYRLAQNPNEIISESLVGIVRPANKTGASGLALDLYEGISIPITFSISDIREPEKKRTSWSKTITIPGTKNNNRIFSHVYEIGQDGWITIGNTSFYEGFNPNLRKECIVMNDGVQVLKGNLQLKRIKKDLNDNIEYEIALNGDLTSLFYDIGTTKLSDLDLSEWTHDWSKTNIENSWYGNSKKDDGTTYASISNGTAYQIKSLYRDATTGRLAVETYSNHNLLEDDFVYIEPSTGGSQLYLLAAKGEWVVTEKVSATKFVVNYFYPVALMTTGSSVTVATASNSSYCYKRTATGEGYVYPLISWGDEYDFNSFAVTNMVPGFYIKGIFDKIMKTTNSNYESTFLDSQFFKRLILIQKKTSFDLTPSQLNDRKFCVGLTGSYTNRLSGQNNLSVQTYYYPTYGSYTSNNIPSTLQTYIPFKKEDGLLIGTTVSFYDSPGSTQSIKNWDESEYKWIVKESGEYALTTNINLSAWIDMNGYRAGTANGTASFLPNDSRYLYYPGFHPEEFTIGPSGNNPSGPLGNYKTGTYVLIKLLRKRNGFIEEIGSTSKSFDVNINSYWSSTNPNWKFFGRYQPSSWEKTNVTISSTKTYFAEGDEVWVSMQTYVQANSGQYSNLSNSAIGFYELYNPTNPPLPAEPPPDEYSNILADFYVKIESSSYIINIPNSVANENAPLPISSILPRDMSCKDFLLAIIKMFNLSIESDKQIERLYYIEPRDTYYKTGASASSDYVDWSTKVDKDSVDIIPMGELIAKYYTFQNKEESDYWNKKFKDDRGRSYSKYTKEVTNDFLKNEVVIEIPLGTTIMINNPNDSDVVMPAVLQKEASGAIKPISNSQPRILIWGGLRPYTAYRGTYIINLNNAQGAQFGWEMLSTVNVSGTLAATSSVYTTYPYAGTCDSPQDPQYDINWYNMEEGDFVYWDNSRWTNENLYNKYWSNFINEISDPSSKVIIAKLRLTNKDIYELDFRKIYLIDGHYLRLQKVLDYDAVNDGLTTCEFLKLKSSTKYVKRSVITDSNGYSNPLFNVAVDTTRPITSIVSEIAPAKRKPQAGYQNTTPGVNLSNSATVQTNGLSNFVSSNTTNIKINGNENAVGNGAKNINISSGNGNYIVGNVTNVNIIGTDKKYIAESDVTYINNIRYKDGIAISKSNVINGGLDVSVIRQSASSNANVINASEDVVITAGSFTYENVINAGQDNILPDVKELGITTTVNPNPRTNLSGSFTLNTGSQSVAQVIRQIDRFRSLS